MKKNEIKKPNFFIWYLLGPLVCLFVRIKYKYKVKKVKIKKNSLVICPHRSYFDAILPCITVFPDRLNMISTTLWFRNPFLARLFKSLGVIPKNQYKNDARSIMDIIGTLKKGGKVLMFAEGQMSVYGDSVRLPEGLSKLIMKVKPNLYLIKDEGAYLSSPRWNKDFEKGYYKAEVIEALTNDKLEDYNLDNINSIINSFYDSLNDFNFMESEPNFKIKKKSIAHGLENIISYCPKCGSLLPFNEHDNILECEKCGYKLEFIKNSYFFKDQKDFKHLGSLFEYEKKIFKEKHKDSIDLTDKVEASYYDNEYNLHEIGEYILNLNNERFIVYNNKETLLEVPLEKVINIVMNFRKGIEIPTEKETYILNFKDPKRVILYWNYINFKNELKQ